MGRVRALRRVMVCAFVNVFGLMIGVALSGSAAAAAAQRWGRGAGHGAEDSTLCNRRQVSHACHSPGLERGI